MGMHFQDDHTEHQKASAKSDQRLSRSHGNIVCKHILNENGEKRCMECVESATRKATELMLEAGKVPIEGKQ